MEILHQPGSSSISLRLTPSATLSSYNSIQDQSALITSPPELRPRDARPEPQNGADCQQALQSASQAIQQASQQASQSIQQASQQASQSIQQASQQASQSAAQASRSASQAIQQAQQSASQSLADASRSLSSVISSASSAISSVQASAASAISRVNGQMQSAELSASAAQSEASSAVLQAGAAVAAATGSAAAAGSSFLAAAAKATQVAQSAVSSVGAAAASQVAQASQQVTASQTQAVTATQAALAIVGSIIASTLITILIYFLIIRHKKGARRRSRGQQSPESEHSSDPKFTVSDQDGTTIVGSQLNYAPAAGTASVCSPLAFSSYFKLTNADDQSKLRSPVIKTSTVPWNPSNPPKAPSLRSWLKLQDGVSPFGPINLPTDLTADSPLGGQLKSPLRTTDKSRSPQFASNLPLRNPKVPIMAEIKTVSVIPQGLPTRNPTLRKPVSPPSNPESPAPLDQKYRESRASVWTDDIPDDGPSPVLQSPPRAPKNPVSVTRGYAMQIPSPKKPVRTTAEWLAERAINRDSSNTIGSQRPSFGFGLPRDPRGGVPSMLGSQGQVGSMQSEEGYAQGVNRFLYPGRGSVMSKMGSDRSPTTTPGVGKAM